VAADQSHIDAVERLAAAIDNPYNDKGQPLRRTGIGNAGKRGGGDTSADE
jgi:hypothetical protein